ncbi:MAG: zinc ribbon domain-containing protein [Candidatus Altiarchaeota archaeon]
MKSFLILFIILILSINTLAQSESDIKKDLELMGFTITDISISQGAASISYEYLGDQSSGETVNDWVKIAIAVIAYTPTEPQIITIKPEVNGVPVYEAKLDSRTLVLYLDGQISLELLVDDIEYVEFGEQQASLGEEAPIKEDSSSIWLWLIGGGAMLLLLGGGALILLILIFILLKRKGKKKEKEKAEQQEEVPQPVQQPTIPAEVKKSFCTECGAQLSAETQFCTECGTKQ